MKRSNCILVYGSTTKGDVVKRFDCILVYGSTTKGGFVKRSDHVYICMYICTHDDKLKEQSTPHLLAGPRWLENQGSTSKELVNCVSSEDLHPGMFEMMMDLHT